MYDPPHITLVTGNLDLHFARVLHSRVEYIDGYVYEVRDEVQVTLCSSTATLSTERLLVGKPQQQQPNVVGQNQE